MTHITVDPKQKFYMLVATGTVQTLEEWQDDHAANLREIPEAVILGALTEAFVLNDGLVEVKLDDDGEWEEVK